MEQAKNENHETDSNSELDVSQQNTSYLLFQLASELYGVPLLSIREVIKAKDIKPVPYMVKHFLGVINLRGQIVSIIDLRIKFGLDTNVQKQPLVIVVQTKYGLLGVVIDDLVSVKKINDTEINRSPILETHIPLEFFLGVAQSDNRLVNLIDISGCISSEELRIVGSK